MINNSSAILLVFKKKSYTFQKIFQVLST